MTGLNRNCRPTFPLTVAPAGYAVASSSLCNFRLRGRQHNNHNTEVGVMVSHAITTRRGLSTTSERMPTPDRNML